MLDQLRSPAIPDVQLDANESISILLKTQLPIDATPAVSDSSSTPSPPRKLSIVDHATSTSQVSAFCRAVLARLVPHEFWGSGEIRIHNEKVICRNIDRFISLRRFESLSLHEVSQGTKVNNLFFHYCSHIRFHNSKLIMLSLQGLNGSHLQNL